jgi:hypothetical protein
MGSTLFFLFTVLFRIAAGIPTNATIDDQLGDSLNGDQVQYLPVSYQGGLVWKPSSDCNDCAIVPATTLAFDNTWTSATYFGAIGNMSAGFNFQGEYNSTFKMKLVTSDISQERPYIFISFCQIILYQRD